MGETTVQRLVMLLGLLGLCSCASQQQTAAVQELSDRVAIHEVMQKYVWSVDSLDSDAYVSVFTEDAEVDSNGTVMRGHEAIRKVVTGMQASQAKNLAEGKPAGALHHVISNERISLQSPTEAIYYSYWQTMRKGTDNRYTAGGFGTSEDHLVKRDGRWLIRYRKLSVFTD